MLPWPAGTTIQTTQAIPGISAQAEEILQHPYGVVAYQGAGAEYAYFRRILGTDGWILIYTAQARAFNRPLTQTRTWLVFSNLLAVALVSSVIYLRAEAITRPLRQMVTVLGDIATGDLTQKVDVVSDDEVGQTARYANLMADGLAGMIRQLKELANIIVTSGQQIAASIEESTSGLEQSSNLATEIGSNMQLNAASIDQTKNAVQYVADSAQMVSQLTSEAVTECTTAVHQANTGNQAVTEVVEAMTEISVSSEQVNQLVENLIDSAQRIEEMLELITQISEQTNLPLSLMPLSKSARAERWVRALPSLPAKCANWPREAPPPLKKSTEWLRTIRQKVNSTSEAVQKSNMLIHQTEDKSRLTMTTIENVVTSINNVEQKSCGSPRRRRNRPSTATPSGKPSPTLPRQQETSAG